MLKYPVLTIAGLDNSGAAGMLADIKTFTMFGCYGMVAETLIAVQNSLGVKRRFVIDTDVIHAQLDAIFEDSPPKAIKLGMLLNEEIINMVADYLAENAKNTPIILDPVMMCKGNISLLSPESERAIVEKLLPLSIIVTPNLPESLIIIGENPAESTLTQEEIADRYAQLDINAVIIKGGHYDEEDHATDIFVHDGKQTKLSVPRVSTRHTHGTGCTLSASITACMARGMDLDTAVVTAKNFITNALVSTTVYSIGQGVGPVDHMWAMDDELSHLQ